MSMARHVLYETVAFCRKYVLLRLRKLPPPLERIRITFTRPNHWKGLPTSLPPPPHRTMTQTQPGKLYSCRRIKVIERYFNRFCRDTCILRSIPVHAPRTRWFTTCATSTPRSGKGLLSPIHWPPTTCRRDSLSERSGRIYQRAS